MADANGQEYITNLKLKGLQILNARAENVTALPTAAVGRFVYLSEVSGDNKAGFYYSDGTKWECVGTTAAEAALDTRLQAVEAQVGGGSGSGSLAETVAAIKADVDQNKKDIATNKSGVAENKSGVAAVKTTADKAAADIVTINGVIGADDSADTVKGRIKALETSSATDEGRLDALEASVGTSDSAGLRGKVATLETTVGGADSGLVKDVADLKSDVAKKANSADVYTTTQADAKIKVATDAAAANAAAIEAINNAGYLTSALAATTYRTIADSYTTTQVDDKIAAAVSSTYKPKGTKTFAQLGEVTKNEGDVYNVSEPFTYEGKNYPAGTNVVWVVEDGAGRWDPLAGVTDLSSYSTTTEMNSAIDTKIAAAGHATTSYVDTELGKKVDKTTTVNGHALSANVTVSAADVGLGNVENTADADKPVSTATQTALDKKVDKLVTKPTDGTYTKVEINAEGQVTAGANLAAADIPSLTASKITDFNAKAAAAAKKIYSGVEFTAGSDWLAIGAKNDISEFPSAVTVYNSDGQIVIANIKYDSTNKQLMYQVDLGGTYTVVVSL